MDKTTNVHKVSDLNSQSLKTPPDTLIVIVIVELAVGTLASVFSLGHLSFLLLLVNFYSAAMLMLSICICRDDGS